MATQRWFIDSGGVINGPISSSELRSLVRDGQVTSDTLLKHELMQDFVPARRIKGLLPAPAAAPASDPLAPPPSLAGAAAPSARSAGSLRQSQVAAPGSAAPSARALVGLPQLPSPPASSRSDDASAALVQRPPQVEFENWTPPAPDPHPAPAKPAGADSGSASANPGASRRPTRSHAASPDAAVGSRRIGRNGIQAGMAADLQALPIEPLEASSLWPLAVLMLVMGWICGGWCLGDRWYLPGTVAPILLLAMGGLPAITIGILAYLKPKNLAIGHVLAVAAFTAVIGILMLMVLQFLAGVAVHSGRFFVHGWIAIAWLALKVIGLAYHLTTSSNAFLRWVGFVFGVGVCEETCKLLPLVYLVLSHRFRQLGFHAFAALGFFSGVGFGIGEALYCYSPWTDNCAVSSNVIRWYSAIPSHGIYSAACAAFLWRLADQLQGAEGFWRKTLVVVVAAGAMALVHGTYDTICSFGVAPSLIMEIISFGILIWVLDWAAHAENDPIGAARQPWVTGSISKHMQIGGLVLAVLMMLLALLWGTDAITAKKAILLAKSPWLKPYLEGIDLPAPSDQGAANLAPVHAHVQLDLRRMALVGTITNTSTNALSNVVIRCRLADDSMEILAQAMERARARSHPRGDDVQASGPLDVQFPQREMSVPVLGPGDSVTIDGSKSCVIEFGDTITIQAENWDPQQLSLPTAFRR